MAEPIYEEGDPLLEYLQDSGDAPAELMPGAHPEFIRDDPSSYFIMSLWLPWFVGPLIETTRSILETHGSRSVHRELAERFKYMVISSSLLSSTLGSAPKSARFASESFAAPPGKWQESTSDARPQEPVALMDDGSSLWTLSLACIAPAAALHGHYLAALLIVAAAKFYSGNVQESADAKASSSLTLESLDALIAAGEAWDVVVSEAIAVLEKEEQTPYYSTASPSSPSSSLRVTLQSILHTTTTQCDNIRQLFSPLTSTAELTQLSEMYGPASPRKTMFSQSPFFLESQRPAPSRPRSPLPPPTPTSAPMNKRSTWSGAPPGILRRRKDKRRSGVSSMLSGEGGQRATASTPASPSDHLRNTTVEEEDEDEPFGIAALDLHRKRVQTGRAINSRQSALLTPTASARNSLTSSRFTVLQSTRNPLSLSALEHALQGALASKRYTSAHLLALRFDEDEDDSYWEDVRSVIGLLTTTFEDATSRLTEVLEEQSLNRQKEDQPSVSPSPDLPPQQTTRRRTPLSFAPLPTHLSRFASHVGAITSALDEAREELSHCMDSLSSEATARNALASYERLRKELGLALRECERARGPLLELVDDESSGIDDDVPLLAHEEEQASSAADDSADDRFDIPSTPERTPRNDLHLAAEDYTAVPPTTEATMDDVTAHLILTSNVQHLPPPGIEQVFEAVSAPPVFQRERSKLTREERIKLAKARRESGMNGTFPADGAKDVSRRDSWGPGGEVVQELKDVIYKVGERRRRMTEAPPSNSAEDRVPPAPLEPSPIIVDGRPLRSSYLPLPSPPLSEERHSSRSLPLDALR